MKNLLEGLALAVILFGILVFAFAILSWQGGTTCCPPLVHPTVP